MKKNLNCDAYYMFTILVVIFLPQILLAMPVILHVSGIINIPLDEKVVYAAMPFVTAAIMFLYSYLCIGRFKLTKPDHMYGIYLPFMVYFAWQFLLWVLFNIFGDNNTTLIIVLLSFNLYGILALDAMNLQTTELMIWLYNAAILGGFAAGERLAFHKTGVCRRPFCRKYLFGILIGCAAVLLLSEGIWFYKRKNIIEVDPSQKGYGFAYEDGLSSTDLSPYYVENEDNILARLNTPSTYTVSDSASMPVLDGAEAAYPVYAAFAYACYVGAITPVAFNNSVIAFERLLDGECDIFFGAKPSSDQQKTARHSGKELVMTPIGKEAFIFFVNSENPVDGLTSEQLRDIYSGKVSNTRRQEQTHSSLSAPGKFRITDNDGILYGRHHAQTAAENRICRQYGRPDRQNGQISEQGYRHWLFLPVFCLHYGKRYRKYKPDQISVGGRYLSGYRSHSIRRLSAYYRIVCRFTCRQPESKYRTVSGMDDWSARSTNRVRYRLCCVNQPVMAACRITV